MTQITEPGIVPRAVAVSPPIEVVTIQIPGIPGSPGAKGDPGAPGPATNLTIGTITTGSPGTMAAAALSGVVPNQVLNLTIPQGAPGPPGDPGPISTLSIGTVTTGSAAVSLTGIAPNQVLNFVLPAGADATSTGKGVIQLSGDLSGNASAPSVVSGAHHTHTSSQISDATAAPNVGTVIVRDSAGRAQVVDPSASADIATKHYVDTATATQVTLAGDLGGTATAPTVIGGTHHTHTASQISDSTTVGRSLVTAVDAPTARTAIGAGTSNLAIGTTNTTAKAGDYQPASANITDAASAATASVVVKRDANARAQFADPSVAADAATKNYVDNQVATKAAIAGDLGGTAAAPTVTGGTHHTHTSSQISDATSAATVSRVIIRDSAGRAQVVDPSVPADVATKNYVDTRDATKVSIGGDIGGTATVPTVISGTNHIHTSAQISDATDTNTPGVVVKRDSNGSFSAASLLIGNTTPTLASESTRKDYVDGKSRPAVASKSTNYTFALTDERTFIEYSNTTAATFTIPTNATVPFPVGSVIDVVQYSSGALTIAGAAGVTVQTATTLTTSAQYQLRRIQKIATDTWFVR